MQLMEQFCEGVETFMRFFMVHMMVFMMVLVMFRILFVFVVMAS